MTARRRSARNQTRRTLYFMQRGMGDVSAAARGPVPYVRRRVRRSLTRAFFRAIR